MLFRSAVITDAAHREQADAFCFDGEILSFEEAAAQPVSEPLLTAVRDAMEALAKKYEVPYLDLNLELKQQINWKTDTVDGGKHLNDKGAEKVSVYMGNYMTEHFSLPDHRGESAYSSWNQDYQTYANALKKIR